MDAVTLISIVLGIIVFIVCSAISILLFIKYKKTRKKIYLALSILLGAFTLAVLLLTLFFVVMSLTVVYGPPPRPGMVYGPPPG